MLKNRQKSTKKSVFMGVCGILGHGDRPTFFEIIVEKWWDIGYNARRSVENTVVVPYL